MIARGPSPVRWSWAPRPGTSALLSSFRRPRLLLLCLLALLLFLLLGEGGALLPLLLGLLAPARPGPWIAGPANLRPVAQRVVVQRDAVSRPLLDVGVVVQQRGDTADRVTRRRPSL